MKGDKILTRLCWFVQICLQEGEGRWEIMNSTGVELLVNLEHHVHTGHVEQPHRVAIG